MPDGPWFESGLGRNSRRLLDSQREDGKMGENMNPAAGTAGGLRKAIPFLPGLLGASLLLLCFSRPCPASSGSAGGSDNPRDGWTTVVTIPLPGRPTRFDYQSLDSRTGLLYLAHLGDGRLVVFDTRTRRVVGDLPGFPHVRGVIVVPSLARVFATVSPLSRSKIGHLAVVDAGSGMRVALLPAGVHPDGLAYEASSGRIFVSNEWGRSISVFDARANKVLGTIPLSGEAGNTEVDPETHRVYVTVQTKNLLVEIDSFALRVTKRFVLPCRHPHGLRIDGPSHRAYVACDGDARVLAVDLGTGRILATLPSGKDPDVLTLDRSRGLLFVASESGVVGVYRLTGGGLAMESEEFLGVRAHSILADPRTHLLYLPLENEGGRPVLRIQSWKGPSGDEIGRMSGSDGH